MKRPQQGKDGGSPVHMLVEPDPEHQAASSRPPPPASTSHAARTGPQASLRLPTGVITYILGFLDGEGLVSCAQVCTELYELTGHDR
jgi:hypothetical protein